MGRKERMKNGGSQLEQKLLTPASRDNDIKTDVVVVVCCLRVMKPFKTDVTFSAVSCSPFNTSVSSVIG